MILPILIWPDSELKKVSAPVTQFNAQLGALVMSLFDTLRNAKGIGLAAPQVGVLQRVVVLAVPGHEPFAMVNPIVSLPANLKKASEGCLSVPGVSAEVERAQECLVMYFRPDGSEVEGRDCTGLLAVAVQHEVDHLDGKVYVELLPRAKREPIRRKMWALKTGEW